MSTLIYRITDPARSIPSMSKPFLSHRPGPLFPAPPSPSTATVIPTRTNKHLGIYLRRDFLDIFPSLPTGPLEAAEKLEQSGPWSTATRSR